MDSPVILLTTFPDVDTARQIGTMLVERKLAACVNLLPGAESLYRWDGRTRSDSEILAVVKSTERAREALEMALIDAHPYDVPECLFIPVTHASRAYAGWILDCVEASPTTDSVAEHPDPVD